MAGLNRRDFLKALGLTSSASVVSACGLDQNYYRSPIEEVLPYVVRPEQIIPGNPTFFATTITYGADAHPVLARHRDGRVINVGANFAAATVSGPGIPTSALLELQRHYSPDRFMGPRLDGTPIEDEVADGKVSRSKWDIALAEFSKAVADAKAAGKKVAYLGPQRSGAFVDLVTEFTGGEAIFWEPLSREAEAIAAEKLFGKRVLPAYDLSDSPYILSFGADFLGTWGGASLQSQYAKARNPNHGQFIARFALVSAHRGQTGANADDWFQAASGSEALVALAIAKLVDEQLAGAHQGNLGPLLAQADVEAAVTASGLTKADLEAIAAQFVAAKGMAVALPGGVAGASAAATELAVATYVLNLVSGNRGNKSFGLGPVYAGPIHDIGRVEQLIKDMNAGAVGVLIVDDLVNPVYNLPASSGFAEALAKVTLVSAASHPNETNAAAKLVLPSADAFEDWGDEEPAVGLHLLRQPSMSPLEGIRADKTRYHYEPRSLGDVLLAVGRSLGMDVPPIVGGIVIEGSAPVSGFSAKNFRDYVKARWEREIYPKAGSSLVFERWWEQSLMDGFVDLRTRAEGRLALDPADVVNTDFAFSKTAAAAEGGKYTLIAYPHPFRHDGRYANEPWAQEVPDPMTGQVWDSWVEIHPDTAQELGLADSDLVEVSVGSQKFQVGVQRYRGVRKDTIAVAFGQGHTAAGRYAQSVGVNVASALAVVKDTSGAMVWQQAKANVAKVGKTDLVTTFGSDFDHKRGIGVVVSAAELAEKGDEPAHHDPNFPLHYKTGELTGLVWPQLDERVTAKGTTDLYPLPDHPTYRFGMTVDVNACNGCGVCAIACYAENNLSVVGKQKVREGREMGWIRVNRYWSEDGESDGVKEIRFVPMMCQHCGHAPCESVCPVLATYHTIDGLNAMIYNRCVGTRYCANNCPYKARRFNWHSYVWPEPFNFQLNPDVTARTMGVMEKCTFCVQRIRAIKSAVKSEGFNTHVSDKDLRQLPACVEACPSQALTFGNLNDPESVPARSRQSPRHYEVFGDLNVFPAVNYLAKASFTPPPRHHGGHGGGHEEGQGGEHEGGHEAHEGSHEAPKEDHNPSKQPAEHH